MANAAPTGYAVKLDLTGYVAYRDLQAGGFTDTSGFVVGTEELRSWAVGARAKLFATIPNGRYTWMPFITGTVDTLAGFHHTQDIPQQILADADTVYFKGADTLWGGRAGLDIVDVTKWRFGVEARYQRAADFSVTGERVYLIVPMSVSDWWYPTRATVGH